MRTLWSFITLTIFIGLHGVFSVQAATSLGEVPSFRTPKNAGAGILQVPAKRGQYSSNDINVDTSRPARRTASYILIQKTEGGVVRGTTNNSQLISCGTTCVAGFQSGQAFGLQAFPDVGYRFKIWEGCEPVNSLACEVRYQQGRIFHWVRAVFEKTSIPVLMGETSSSSKNIKLNWTYDGFGSELEDQNSGYLIEESIVSESTGWKPIPYPPDTTPSGFLELTKTTGTYWYQVRAKHRDRTSPYSNVVKLQVKNYPQPETLRIINDLTTEIGESCHDACEKNTCYGDCNNWGILNAFVHIHVGQDNDDSLLNEQSEKLFPYDSTTRGEDTEWLPPKEDGSSFKDIDISGLSATEPYYIFIQAGWWEYVTDPYTNTTSWEKAHTEVPDCNGNPIPKNVTIRVNPPFTKQFSFKASEKIDRGIPVCPP